jgi:hypothetical protein
MQRSAIVGLTLFAAIAVPTAPAAALNQVVATYHYDNWRTGWNRNETTLTPANVGSTSFGVLAQVVLDDQVDAQPLVVPMQQITAGPGPAPLQGSGAPRILYGAPNQVVYVATESNTVYAIRASDGTVLVSRHLGTPVLNPITCGSNTPNAGIKGTPVIDVTTQTLYVIAYISMSGTPTYQLFALNLKNLTNRIPPVTVAASHTLNDGTPYIFNAAYQRQRPALLESSGIIPLGLGSSGVSPLRLESSGIIYAGFGSFCDFNADQSRGWLLGWQASTLTPLPANRLTDTQATDTGSFFLSAIWMSGYGIAADPTGNLFFSTGNSDNLQNTYDGKTNIQESVVKLDPNLNLLDIFTPSNENSWDASDKDFGSGGVLVLPPQPGPFPDLAVAAGKSGTMYLLNRDKLGGFTSGDTGALDKETVGACWCGPSYFTGSDGIGRVVSSGCSGCTSTSGATLAQITVWKVQTSPTVALVQEGAAKPVASGQDGGTFTSVSSNGTQAAVIWATGEPLDSNPAAVKLYAFDATPSGGTLPLLYSSQAGNWPFTAAAANIVPVVANGKVYVASNKQLTIFGLGGHPFVARAGAAAQPEALNTHMPPHAITGVLEQAGGAVLTLRTRTGKLARVDDSEALRRKQTGVLVLGSAYTAQGTYDSTGALHAEAVARAKGSPSLWPLDR